MLNINKAILPYGIEFKCDYYKDKGLAMLRVYKAVFIQNIGM